MRNRRRAIIFWIALGAGDIALLTIQVLQHRTLWLNAAPILGIVACAAGAYDQLSKRPDQ